MNIRFLAAARISSLVMFALILAASTAFGQQVTMLEIRKDGDRDHRTTVEILVPMTLAGFDLDNPMDAEQSALSTFEDDSGRDLLQIHRARQAELREQGFTTQQAMSFGGVADYGANKDIKLRISVDAAASEGARILRLAGKAVLNFAGEGEPVGLEIVDVPVEMPYDSQGFASEIGPIVISADGSAEMGGVSYRKFTVSGTENSIVSAVPVDGDDSAEVDFWALGDNQFVFKEVPQTVSLEVEYTPIRKVPVALDIEFSVGL